MYLAKWSEIGWFPLTVSFLPSSGNLGAGKPRRGLHHPARWWSVSVYHR